MDLGYSLFGSLIFSVDIYYSLEILAHFSLACARLSVCADEQKMRTISEKRASEKQREGRRVQPVSMFTNTPERPLLRPLPEKPFLLLK